MLKDLLDNKECFKLVCGAGNEDAEEVENLLQFTPLQAVTSLTFAPNPKLSTLQKRIRKSGYKRKQIFMRKCRN